MNKYRIHYQAGSQTGHFPGVFDEATKNTWLAHLARPENSDGIRYWAEPVKAEPDDNRALETAKRLANK